MNRVSVEECQKISVQLLKSAFIDSSVIELNGQAIQLTTTKCKYGGERVWFLCPACRKRVGTIYRRPLAELFLCRHCLNLTYDLRRYHRSRQESAVKALSALRYKVNSRYTRNSA
jgi:hypothetical protein